MTFGQLYNGLSGLRKLSDAVAAFQPDAEVQPMDEQRVLQVAAAGWSNEAVLAWTVTVRALHPHYLAVNAAYRIN